MATDDAAGRPAGPEPASYWRVEAVELATPGLWDVQAVEVLLDEPVDIIEHLGSGSAGEGYEPAQAFRTGPSWWGGRPERGGDGVSRCFIGAVFEQPVVPEAISLVPAPGPHRAPRVEVQSSCDGVEWTTVDEVELPMEGDAHTVFYSPVQAPAAPAWRMVAQSTSQGFAWDVHRVRFLRRGGEVPGVLRSSGDAGAGFEVDRAGGGDGFWGGRADAEGRIFLQIDPGPAAGDDIALDRIVLDQGHDHWARSVLLETRDPIGRWHVARHLGGLRPGRNDLLLARQPARPAADALVSPVSAPSPSRERDAFADHRILVLIAAYRDPELAATVNDAIAQAAYPEHLRFAICHQHDDETAQQLAPWADDPRFRIDAVDHRSSRGCCWARNRTFAMYDDEPYVLQIDAHMRFAPRWDVRYIDMLESTGAKLPILSSYPPRYTIGDDGTLEFDLDSGAQRLYIDELHPDLTTRQKTAPLADPTRPEPSPMLAAGQLFTRGRFCRDVDYDPDIYFGGEEISMAARAFTSGYDLFAPHENLVWHLYQHEHPKHWDDHRDHADRHRAALDRLRTLFRGDHRTLGRYGLGSTRTLAEFEEHAGVRLGAPRANHDGSVTVEIDRSIIEPRDDYAVFVVVFLDDDGGEVDRREVRAPDVLDLGRSTVSFSSVPATASRTVVLTVTTSGSVGELAIRPLGGGDR